MKMNVFSQEIVDAVTLDQYHILMNTRALEVGDSRKKWNLRCI